MYQMPINLRCILYTVSLRAAISVMCNVLSFMLLQGKELKYILSYLILARPYTKCVLFNINFIHF